MAPWLTVAGLARLATIQQPDRDILDAARRGDIAAVRSMLDAGVDIDTGNRYGATALFFAAEKGHLELVRLLVDRGARVDIEDSFYRNTAINRAMQGGHPDVIGFLLSRGTPGADGALGFAVSTGDAELAKQALGSSSLTRDGYDEALAAAREREASDLVALLSEVEPSPVPLPCSFVVK